MGLATLSVTSTFTRLTVARPPRPSAQYCHILFLCHVLGFTGSRFEYCVFTTLVQRWIRHQTSLCDRQVLQTRIKEHVTLQKCVISWRYSVIMIKGYE